MPSQAATRRQGRLSRYGHADRKRGGHDERNGDPEPVHVAAVYTTVRAQAESALFTFLFEPTVIDATNWRAEQALRPAVVTRKVCGANRSPHGATSRQLLASVIRTAPQRQLNPHAVLVSMLRARTPIVPVALRDRAQ